MSVYNTTAVYHATPSPRSVQSTLYKGDVAPVYETYNLVDDQGDRLVDSDGNNFVVRERV